MKNQLTSVDVRYLASELNKNISSSRIDKAYQLGSKELKLRVHVTGIGAIEVVIAPTYICATNYPRKAPEEPTNFAMQLRKNFKGAYVREITQHNFDRIIEFLIETPEKKFILVAELFSKGNVILCDGNKKILGLLEWQTWKDRTLRVGQIYEYPPETADPLSIDSGVFLEILAKTNKKIAAAIATETGIGGLYAEEICLGAEVEKDSVSKELSEEQKNMLLESFNRLIEKIKSGKSKPQAIIENEIIVDVVPFDLEIYKGYQKKEYPFFNDAVDDFYSKKEFTQTEKKSNEKFGKEMSKLVEIKQSQERHLHEFERESVESKIIGDLIYQNYQELEAILKIFAEERGKGLGWGGLKNKYAGKEVAGLIIEDIHNDGTLTLKLKK